MYNKLDLLISYHEDRFEMIPLILPDRQYGICGKGETLLHSCRYYRGEPHEIYCEVLETKKTRAF